MQFCCRLQVNCDPANYDFALTETTAEGEVAVHKIENIYAVYDSKRKIEISATVEINFPPSSTSSDEVSEVGVFIFGLQSILVLYLSLQMAHD